MKLEELGEAKIKKIDKIFKVVAEGKHEIDLDQAYHGLQLLGCVQSKAEFIKANSSREEISKKDFRNIAAEYSYQTTWDRIATIYPLFQIIDGENEGKIKEKEFMELLTRQGTTNPLSVKMARVFVSRCYDNMTKMCDYGLLLDSVNKDITNLLKRI